MASYAKTQAGDIVLILSPLEAQGLVALVSEGAAGLFEDAEAAKVMIGNKKAVDAAKRAKLALDGASVP